MERDISFSLLIKIFKKSWWKILIIALAVMMVVAAYTHFFVPKKYRSSIQFYIVNIDANTDYASSQMLSAAGQLVNDYTDIIKSEYMLSAVQEKLEEKGYQNVTIPALQSMIQHSAKSDSSVFTLSIVHTNPTVAYDVASIIAETAPEIVTKIAKPESKTYEGLGQNIWSYIKYYNEYVVAEGEPKVNVTRADIINTLKQADPGSGLTTKLNCIDVLTPPKMATTHISPNLVTSTLLGGIAAFVVAYVVFLLKSLFEQSIVSDEDLKKLVVIKN